MPMYNIVITHEDDTVSVAEDLEAKDERDAFMKVSEIFKDSPAIKSLRFFKKEEQDYGI